MTAPTASPLPSILLEPRNTSPAFSPRRQWCSPAANVSRSRNLRFQCTESAPASGAIGISGVFEEAERRGVVDPVDGDELLARAVAAHDVDPRGRHAERPGDELDQRRVRAAV